LQVVQIDAALSATDELTLALVDKMARRPIYEKIPAIIRL